MSGVATIAITVGVAVAVLVGFFLVYYLGNVANTIYEVKVGILKQFDKKIKEFKEFVDKEFQQRLTWIRAENKEEMKRLKTSMNDEIEETFAEMQKTIERLRADVTSLQKQLGDLQGVEGATPLDDALANAQANLDAMENGEAAARTFEMETPVAPETNMAAPNRPQQDRTKQANKAKTANKKPKKKRNPDEFEAFSSFKNDFGS